MGKQRYINSDFWNDTWIVDKLTPLEQHLFMYLLTNQRANLCGIYELSTRIMAVQTGLEKAEIEAMLERMKPKVFYENGWVVLANAIKHQAYLNDKIKTGIKRELSSVPSQLLQHIKWPTDFDRKGIKGQQQTSILDSLPIADPYPMQGKSHLTIRSAANLTGPGLTKTADAMAAEPPDEIGRLYYQVIEALDLPVRNHKNVKAKIQEMSKAKDRELIVQYLTFMRDKFGEMDWPYKPDVSEALDIHDKRAKIINSVKRQRGQNEIARF